MHLTKNTVGRRVRAWVMVIMSLALIFSGVEIAVASSASAVTTTQTVVTKSAKKVVKKKAKKKKKKKAKKKTAKKATPTYAPIAGIDTRCQVPGIALCASKAATKLFVVVNGQVAGALDTRFGRPGMNTPNGLFHVYMKNANAYSYKYGARMPFSLFFLRGYAIHFSDEFTQWGWSSPTGGSHGCVNLRDWAGAQWVYNSSPIGTRVVVY